MYYLILSFFFFFKINSVCRPITADTETELQPDCSFLVDTEVHTEYEDLDLLGKYVLLWFGYAYSGYVQDQVEGAVDWFKDLSAERQDQTAIVFVNSHLYAGFVGNLEEKIPEEFEGNVYVVQEDVEVWSWDYYGGDSNKAKILDPYGMVADQFASYGSRHSSLISNRSPIKLSFDKMFEDGESPCEEFAPTTTTTTTTTTLSPKVTLTFQFLDVVGGCADNYLHLSELTFYMDKDSADSQLNPVYCDSISSFGDSPTNEQIEKAHDGDVATKWLDKKMRGCNPCEVRCVISPDVQYYRLATADDSPNRDPISWSLSSCPDNGSECKWNLENTTPPSERQTIYDTSFSVIRDPSLTFPPTSEPTIVPTQLPTIAPTQLPTTVPTQLPTPAPTTFPTTVPTQNPTSTCEPTATPTAVPTSIPTEMTSSSTTAPPLPYPQDAINELNRKADELTERVEQCEDVLKEIQDLSSIQNTLQECFVSEDNQFSNPESSSESELPYNHENESWYQELKQNEDPTYLNNDAFRRGTFRISQPGRYVLTEDIVFDPLPDNESFPKIYDPEYPMNYYFLGFFAAITVETSNVWIDLNGFTIKQSLRHNTLQRFYNNIELADRLFVKFEGMFSLNYQTNDYHQYDEDSTRTHGSIKSAANVIISNGVLGLSSHNGIHGNGNKHIVVENVHVKDFEVAGIQLNGADNVAIVDCEVGPSNQNVLFNAQWSNAVVMKRYLQLFIPYSLEYYKRESLINGEISFADRPDEISTFQEVFDELITITDMYTDFVVDGEELNDAEIHEMFNNTLGLPDGSAMYGVFIHRLGAGPEMFAAQDENYLGPEHENIVLKNLHIHDLKNSPDIVPSLGFNDGTLLQGPARDAIQFLTVIKESKLMGIFQSTYNGNPISDAYVAMAKLSESFYKSYIYDSQCGNFASNLTSSFLDLDKNCSGTVMNATLSGRDVVMIQKRIFGGLKISQPFIDWATIPETPLEHLFLTRPDFKERRQTKHNIVCYHDALFHPNKGLVGVRIEFVQNVLMENIEIDSLYNGGDDDHFLCERSYRLSNLELIEPVKWTPGRHLGPDVRGFAVGKCESVEVKNVNINSLISEEGAVIGFDVITDTSDRSDYTTPAESFKYDNVEFGMMKGGRGSLVRSFASQYVTQGISDVITKDIPTIHNEYDNSKMNILFENFPFSTCHQSPEEGDVCLEAFGADEAFMRKINREFEKYLKVTFGIEIHFDPEKAWWEVPTDPEGKWAIVSQVNRGEIKMVCRKENCDLPAAPAEIRENYRALIPNEDIIVYGTYGGIHGKTVYASEFLVSGAYRLFGIAEDVIRLQYFAECPLSHTTMYYTDFQDPHRISYMINCALDSPDLGVGHGIGLLGGFCSNDMEPGFYETSVVLFTFDDVPERYLQPVEAPQESIELTTYWSSVSEGTWNVAAGKAGLLSHPLTNAYHMKNEAATKYFRYWMNFNDNQTHEFRNRAFEFFRDHMKIPSIKVDLFNNEPLDNSIDLGGGNVIVPYTTSDQAKHHLVGMRSSSGTVSTQARIHEVGFAINVGRAGLWTYAGHIQFGGLIQFGYYIIELEDENVFIEFYDHYPEVPNSNSHFAIVQRLVHPTLGNGLLHGLAKIVPDGDVHKIESRMSWKWSP